MNKTISILILLAAMLTSCGQNTNTASKPVTSSEIITEETTSESPSEAVTTDAISTTSTSNMPTTTSTQPTTAVSTSSSTAEEKEAEITETSAESEPVVTTSAAEKTQENISAETTSAASTTSNAAQTTTTKATTTAKATTTTVRTEPITEPVTEPPTETETEPKVILKHDGTDYGKAKAVYDYMVVHGTGTCVNYSYQTMQICKNIGLECLYVQTPAELYAHVANAVKVDGKWFVLDAYAECFLTENMCGFTQLLDENENFISDASILSSVRYDEL